MPGFEKYIDTCSVTDKGVSRCCGLRNHGDDVSAEHEIKSGHGMKFENYLYGDLQIPK